ncbi:MAG: DUF2948 family protein [Pseudomonadota bacterium]
MTDTAASDPGNADGLRLRARDKEDVQVIAACLQDALIPLREMAFMAEERRFLAAFSRFQWERLADPVDASGLTLCQSVLRIDHVDSVQYRGLDRELDGVKFELLTIIAEPADAGGFKVTLLFAGDVALRLQVDQLALALEDFGEPSLASATPKHDLSTSKKAGS